jgi:hypothetical protein
VGLCPRAAAVLWHAHAHALPHHLTQAPLLLLRHALHTHQVLSDSIKKRLEAQPDTNIMVSA